MEPLVEMTLVLGEMTLVLGEPTLVLTDTMLPPDGLPPATCRSWLSVNRRNVSFLNTSLRDEDC
jgi:hypothetical protein